MRIFTVVNLVLNSASILGGVLVCLILAAIRIYDKSLVDRVSLRLTAAVSTVDSVKAASYIIFTLVSTPGAACGATAWLILFLTNLYTFLSVAIAFNLQWVSTILISRPNYPSSSSSPPSSVQRLIHCSTSTDYEFKSQLFLLGKRVHPNLEKSYFVVSILLAVATTVPPWVRPIYDWLHVFFPKKNLLISALKFYPITQGCWTARI